MEDERALIEIMKALLELFIVNVSLQDEFEQRAHLFFTEYEIGSYCTPRVHVEL